MTLTVEKVYDPIPPSEESKGRKSYKVIMTDGESYYAGDDVGPHMTVGHSYDNLDVGLDKYGNKWLNWAKGKPGNGGTPAQPRPPEPPRGAASPPQNQSQQGYYDAQRTEDMFVMGIVGRAMGSGQFGITDIGVLTRAAVEAWNQRHTT